MRITKNRSRKRMPKRIIQNVPDYSIMGLTRKSKNNEMGKIWNSRADNLSLRMVDDLINHSPILGIHISIICKILNRPIQIWSDGILQQVFGKPTGKSSLDVEYKTNGEFDGHFSLKGGKEPFGSKKRYKNNCFFDVVWALTGYDANELRLDTAKYLRENASLKRKLDSSRNNLEPFICGGARYVGTCSEDAGLILDECQISRCHMFDRFGHPRAHVPAADPSIHSDNYSCIQRYSMMKLRLQVKGPNLQSAFLSKEDQDFVCHLALISPRGKAAIELLAQGSFEEVLHLPSTHLDHGKLPKGQFWMDGQMSEGLKEICKVTLILRHHKNCVWDDSRDVFIFTIFPHLVA